MHDDYLAFLERRTQLDGQCGFEPHDIPDHLFPFQHELVEWAVRQGRGAIFADCGLGKTPMQLAWAQNVVKETSKPLLLVTPLGVTHQTAAEAAKFGVEAVVSRNGEYVAPITITNYDRLHLFDPAGVGGLVCDESSAIKNFSGERRKLVTDYARKLPYRLLCTATAAPNDYLELGSSSEALGGLGHMDMLGKFFVADNNATAATRRHGQQPKFRFKGHAEEPFWRWVSSWARAMRRPSDYGYSDDRYDLPELILQQHVVGDYIEAEGKFAVGLKEERAEARATIVERCETAASLLQFEKCGIAWCQLNDEGDLLTEMIDGAVQVKGGDSADKKEEALTAFSRGEIRVLVTKPSIAGWGLNWTHCNRMTFFPSHSYEQYYQAVRRCWRFGQERPVTVDLVTTPGASRALANLERKSANADRMFDELVKHMRNGMHVDRSTSYNLPMEVPAWACSTKR